MHIQSRVHHEKENSQHTMKAGLVSNLNFKEAEPCYSLPDITKFPETVRLLLILGRKTSKALFPTERPTNTTTITIITTKAAHHQKPKMKISMLKLLNN